MLERTTREALHETRREAGSAFSAVGRARVHRVALTMTAAGVAFLDWVMSSVYAVIMAGGRGERFWPLSTDRQPKPFVRLLGSQTLVEQAVERLLPLIPAERILLSIGEAQDEIARSQLPQLPARNFIVEPIGRDTSACLGFCALHLERRDPDAVVLVLPADHFIGDDEAFRRTLQTGIRNLPGAAAVVFGIQPSRPDVGYGYIQAEKPAVPAESWPVIRFVEKPDIQTAARYIASGNFFWNSGIFLWQNATLLRLFERHMPETHRGLCELRPLLGEPGARAKLLEIFSQMPRISIDYGILEKAPGLRLVPVEFGWDDIGNWQALERALPADAQGNVALGSFLGLESRGCIAYTDSGTVAAYGVSDLVIVQGRGRVLVCSRDKAADLKRLVGLIPGDLK
jgi:mannose-1-phosphate guanylyltransferase